MAERERRASFWDRIFRRPQQKQYNIEDVLSGIYPVYSNGQITDIYSSDSVQNAIYSIVTEMSKLDAVHESKSPSNHDFVVVDGNIQKVLDNPNPLMTAKDYIEKVTWLLLLNYNAFIYPIWSGDTLVALYPLNPSRVDFQKDGTGKIWVVFTFPNGYEGEVAYEDIIHLRYKFSVSEFMGGNLQGQPDLKPLLDTINLNDTLLKGLAKSLNIQTTINGVVKMKTMVNADDQIAKIKEFERKLQANESGLLPLDVSAEYTPITKQVNLLDDKVLKFLDKKTLRYYGVSEAIADGDFTPQQLQAFHTKVIDGLSKTFSQGHTKGIFTKRQIQGFNNRIRFCVREMLYMNVQEKLTYFTEANNIGANYVNEFRTSFGWRADPKMDGVRMMSLNYINVEDAKKYQVGDKEETKPNDNGGVNNGEN